jgi:titin
VRADGGDGNCKCCTSTDGTPGALVDEANQQVYENAAHHPVSAVTNSAKSCSDANGWENCQGGDCPTIASCAIRCAGYAFFVRADIGSGDNNCRCCTSTDGTPGALVDEANQQVYENAAHPTHITCTACPNGKTVVAQPFTVATAGANGANRFCTLKSGFSGTATYAALAASASWAPTFGSPTPTANGFTVQISNHDADFTWAGTATASGSVAISGSGLVTVTGVAGGTASTATITTTRTGYTAGTATVTATSSVVVVDCSSKGNCQATCDSSSFNTCSGSQGPDGAEVFYCCGTCSGTFRCPSDTGLEGCACNEPANTCNSATTCANTGGCAADFYQTAGNTSSANARCTACPGGKTQTAQVFTADASGANRYCTLKSGFFGAGYYTGRAAAASWVPTFGSPLPTANGFTVQISNHDANFAWAGTATASGIVAISGSGLVTVTDVASNTASTATITTTRSAYTDGAAAVTATSIASNTGVAIGGAVGGIVCLGLIYFVFVRCCKESECMCWCKANRDSMKTPNEIEMAVPVAMPGDVKDGYTKPSSEEITVGSARRTIV